ncbi:tripartite tricarboxylate transporter TctB family protein [Hansschlegelia zhihuaiae]|uniref:Tripartite tricarboxylate transporter TctB family protein n=1 Tax=Hansschlegelia zhihuaiae TaxID=405005 RepID=A0A4Q0MLH3_9HYPH|nr:tripartite tricarboxylate transporter TctB family protein [Hansschlegelia zhihuaiae]RXF74275.1 tripartite tricarboxylate transporter TctB family protein [Hansschlegelia zhihuaiae]
MSSAPAREQGVGGRLAQALPYILLLVATVWLWTVADGIEYDARPGELGPSFWPRAALVMMGALSLLQIVTTLFAGAEAGARGVGAQLVTEEDEDDAPRQPVLLLAGIGLTIAYGLVLNTIGFPLATTAFLVAFMYLGGSRSHLAIWASSVVGVLLVTVLLLKVVYVSLPRGAAPFDRVADLITGF